MIRRQLISRIYLAKGMVKTNMVAMSTKGRRSLVV
jgi:hypothetical protein